MITVILTLIGICILSILFCCAFFIKNELTYRVRTTILFNYDYDKYYAKLPDYNKMLFSFTLPTVKYWLKYIEKQ